MQFLWQESEWTFLGKIDTKSISLHVEKATHVLSIFGMFKKGLRWPGSPISFGERAEFLVSAWNIVFF